MTSNLPEHVPTVDAEIVDDSLPVAAKPVCWWRCGPCPRHPDKTASQWGVQVLEELASGDIYMRDNQTGHTVKINAEKWDVQVNPMGELVSVDLLCHIPPALPQAIDWQRITYWNDKVHPGDNQDKWRWDFDGPESFK
jgi:hypothetical protein